MPFHPGQSSEAHPEIHVGRIYAAASSPSLGQDSLSFGSCDLRGPQVASCDRGEEATQPFPHDARPDLFEQLAEQWDYELPPEVTWREIGVVCFAIALLWLFLFALDGGLLR